MSAVDDIKLDNRIVGGLQSVITAKDVLNSRAADRLSLVGVAGYAADNIASFSDLNNQEVKKCVEVRPGQVYPFCCAPIEAPELVAPYQFFIRESHVLIFREQEKPKELKARPFTITEFRQRFYPPCVVCYRLKDIRGAICSPVIVGQITEYNYILGDDDSLEIVLSGMSSAVPLKARWLFDHVEWSPSGDLVDWRPFGVEGV